MKYLTFNNIAYFLLIGIVVVCLYKLKAVPQANHPIGGEAEYIEQVYHKILGGMIVGEGRRITTERFQRLDSSIDTVSRTNSLKGNSIVLYYSEINCMVCIEEAIQHLEERAKADARFNYQIVARYENIRDAIVFKKANRISREILKPLSGDWGKCVFMNDPFIAVMDDSYNLHHVFILDTESKEKVKQYLDLMKYSKYL